SATISPFHDSATPYTYPLSLHDALPIYPRQNATQFAYDAAGRLTKDSHPGGGWIALERSEKPGGFEVAVATALKPATTYRVEKLPGGGEKRLNQCCCGAETILELAADGSRKTIFPDGSVGSLVNQPDPHWGMQ